MQQGVFPFGRKVKVLRQDDTSPKKVFVLGVYASAVHARWLDREGRQRVAALAVASEPWIFWDGHGAEEIVSRIKVPAAAGLLLPAQEALNGPSGRSLDSRFLQPLGLPRSDVWLCDLYPYAMLNGNQLDAIRRKYTPLASKQSLPHASLERAPTVGPGQRRVHQVLTELRKSRASVLILLGDKPIAWFLSEFEPGYHRLSDFGDSPAEYGQLHRVVLDGTEVEVLPLVHPRQASRLGASSPFWGNLHDKWVNASAPRLLH
jgi:hypothetical protein